MSAPGWSAHASASSSSSLLVGDGLSLQLGRMAEFVRSPAWKGLEEGAKADYLRRLEDMKRDIQARLEAVRRTEQGRGTAGTASPDGIANRREDALNFADEEEALYENTSKYARTLLAQTEETANGSKALI